MADPIAPNNEDQHVKAEERNLFLFITVILFPMLSIMLVGGLGFIIWISQLILGPPGV